MLEIASENLPASEIEAMLRVFNWSAEQINQFSKTYFEYQSKITTTLKLFGVSPPKLIDVNWRLDYEIEVIKYLARVFSKNFYSYLYLYSQTPKVLSTVCST